MITPKGHYVLIKPDEVSETSEGGIILNNNVRQERAATVTGEIVAIGPMAWKAFDGADPNWVPWAEVGERVYFTKYVSKVIIDEETEVEYFLISDENILAGV